MNGAFYVVRAIWALRYAVSIQTRIAIKPVLSSVYSSFRKEALAMNCYGSAIDRYGWHYSILGITPSTKLIAILKESRRISCICEGPQSKQGFF